MNEVTKFSPDVIVVRLHDVINNPDAFLYRLLLGVLAGRMSLIRTAQEEGSVSPIVPTFLFDPSVDVSNQRVIDVVEIAHAGQTNKSIYIPGWGDTPVVHSGDRDMYVRDWKAACSLYRLNDCESKEPVCNWFDFDILMSDLVALSYNSFNAQDLIAQDLLCQQCMLLACGGYFSRMVHMSYGSVDSSHPEPQVNQWSQEKMASFLQTQTLAGYTMH
jgi:hypothetical protein